MTSRRLVHSRIFMQDWKSKELCHHHNTISRWNYHHRHLTVDGSIWVVKLAVLGQCFKHACYAWQCFSFLHSASTTSIKSWFMKDKSCYKLPASWRAAKDFIALSHNPIAPLWGTPSGWSWHVDDTACGKQKQGKQVWWVTQESQN